MHPLPKNESMTGREARNDRAPVRMTMSAMTKMTMIAIVHAGNFLLLLACDAGGEPGVAAAWPSLSSTCCDTSVV